MPTGTGTKPSPGADREASRGLAHRWGPRTTPGRQLRRPAHRVPVQADPPARVRCCRLPGGGSRRSFHRLGLRPPPTRKRRSRNRAEDPLRGLKWRRGASSRMRASFEFEVSVTTGDADHVLLQVLQVEGHAALARLTRSLGLEPQAELPGSVQLAIDWFPMDPWAKVIECRPDLADGLVADAAESGPDTDQARSAHAATPRPGCAGAATRGAVRTAVTERHGSATNISTNDANSGFAYEPDSSSAARSCRASRK